MWRCLAEPSSAPLVLVCLVVSIRLMDEVEMVHRSGRARAQEREAEADNAERRQERVSAT